MDKLRVGIIVRHESLPTEGGRYSYHDSLLQGINEFDFHPELELVNIILYNNTAPKLNLKKETFYIKSGFGSSAIKFSKKVLKRDRLSFLPTRYAIVDFFYKIAINRRNKRIETQIRAHKIDLVYYLNHELHVLNYPFITTNWDIAHKSTYAFPEFALNKNYELREKYYLYTLNKAFLILCESEAGAKELKNFYSLYTNKIRILPLFGGNITERNVSDEAYNDTLKKYGLVKNKFFIYPAQFWPCKNHYNLIFAFKKLVSEANDKELKLMLCGSDMGNLSYIKGVIASAGLELRVLTPGFVSNDELYILYKNAIALTMSTYLGPTNMPLIEAAHLSCAVVCSDLEGHREIMGNNALYFDPSSVDEICSTMKRILDNDFRDIMTRAAFRHINDSPFNLDKSLQVFNDILLEAKPIRKAWGTDYSL